MGPDPDGARFVRFAAALGAATLVVACSPAPAHRADAATVVTIDLSEELPSQGRLGGVTVGADGSVYVSNFGASVWKVAPDGSVRRLPVDLQGSSGNHALEDGRVLQASFLDNRVVAIAPDGDVRDLPIEGLDGPVGLTADSAGRIFVCNCHANTITVTDPEVGTRVLARGAPLDCPNGITLGPDGMLYVVSYSDPAVVRISSATGELTTLATLPEAPSAPGQNAHIAFAAGRLWVTRIQQGELYVVDFDGSAERVLGGMGQEIVDGPADVAQLAHPNGVGAGPQGRFLFLNDIVGPWRGEGMTRMVLRRFGPLPAPG